MNGKRMSMVLMLAGMLVFTLSACSSSEKKESADTQAENHAQMDDDDHSPMAQNGTMNHAGMTMQETAGKQAGEQLIYYTCPMPEHKHVHSKEPGQCPECGMNLVQAVVTDTTQMEFWGCTMEDHSHVRQAESGKCPECGMNLKPMRLVKS